MTNPPASRSPARSTSGERVTLEAICYVGVVALVLGFIWFAYLQRVSPMEPNLASGQVEALSNHGDVVYVRGYEMQGFVSLMIGSPIAVFGAGLLLRLRHPKWDGGGFVRKLALGLPVLVLMLVMFAAQSSNGDIPFGWFGL